MEKLSNLASLNMLKMKLEKKELEQIPLNKRKNILEYANSLGYKFSINKYFTVIKLVNPLNNKSGYIKWHNNSLLWGYFAPDGDNKRYICLHNIDTELSTYNRFKNILIPINNINSGINLMRRMFYGIIDLELK